MIDAAFLAALAQSPEDPVLRSVYADFLDDANRHDDADLLRADAALRDLPVWSDAYWQHHARRAELRPRCDPAWLRATALDGSRPGRFFRDGYPDGVRERWRLVRAFASAWYGRDLPDVGGRGEQIDAEERRLGLTLGPSLREFVAFCLDTNAGAPDGPFRRHRYELRVLADPPVLGVLACEGAWSGVPLDSVGEDDPVVRFLVPDDGTTPENPRYAFDDDYSRPQAVSALVVNLCLGSLPSRLRFSFGWEQAAGILPEVNLGPGRETPVIAIEESGALVACYSLDDSGDVYPLVIVHPRVPWSRVPPEVVRLARIAHGASVADRSPENLADLAALFGDEQPDWLRRMLDPRLSDDDIPF